MKCNEELAFIWQYKVGDYVTIESRAWGKLGFDPIKPDFSIATDHTFFQGYSNSLSSLTSWDESQSKAVEFALNSTNYKLPYGVVLKIEKTEGDLNYIKKASSCFGKEKEWYVYGPVKAQIIKFVPSLESFDDKIFWHDYFKNYGTK